MHVDPTRVTVGQWLSDWLEAMRDGLSRKSHERYGEIIENFLKPELGALKIAKLAPAHIQAAYSKWGRSGRRDGKQGGLSPATRQYIHRVLRAALRCAVEQQVIARNPSDVLRNRLPKVERKEMATLTSEESAKLVATLEGSRLQWPVLLALGTGMRRGEILALRWKNCDLNRGEIRVVESLEQSGSGRTGLRFKAPKSDKSRVILLPAFMVDRARKAKIAQAEELLRIQVRQTGETLVCCQADALPYQPRSFTHAFTREVARAKEIPRVSFHDLRHTHATQLLLAGVHPKVAQERLGHSTVSTTLDLYSHVTTTMQQDAADRLDAALGHAISGALSGK
jgi:integrase